MKKTRNSQCRFTSVLLALLMTISSPGCGATELQISAPAQEELTAIPQSKIKSEDTVAAWDSSAASLSLNGTSIILQGQGAAVRGNTAIITAAGTYVLSGTLTDGQIRIEAAKDDLIHLVLNGAEITNSTGAAIYASQCDKLVITLAEGTQNCLTDGGTGFQYADETEEEPNAALFCKDDLTINGTGALTVNAGFHNGIGTKDDLLIVSGTISVTAPNHGLRGNDSVTILSGNLTLNAGKDGIQTNNTQDADKGYVLIQGGEHQITAASDGVQADTWLAVSQGDLRIATGSSTDGGSDSFKGLKSAGRLSISGGTAIIESQDDCLHAGGNIEISGGFLTLNSGDDGIHSDGDLFISGGEITVVQSYEGLEAANITISGGDIRVTASDDGVNAAGGMDSSGMGGRFGRDHFGEGGDYAITITGGTVYNVSGGDGIDSNGSYTMTGGTVISLIQSSPDNGALDCDSNISVTGGTLIYGGTGIGGVPSPQSYIYLSSGISEGMEISLVKDGTTLASFVADLACQQLIFSTPEMVGGERYEIIGDGSQLAEATAGEGAGGGSMRPGPGGGNGGGRRRGW